MPRVCGDCGEVFTFKFQEGKHDQLFPEKGDCKARRGALTMTTGPIRMPARQILQAPEPAHLPRQILQEPTPAHLPVPEAEQGPDSPTEEEEASMTKETLDRAILRFCVLSNGGRGLSKGQ